MLPWASCKVRPDKNHDVLVFIKEELDGKAIVLVAGDPKLPAKSYPKQGK